MSKRNRRPDKGQPGSRTATNQRHAYQQATSSWHHGLMDRAHTGYRTALVESRQQSDASSGHGFLVGRVAYRPLDSNMVHVWAETMLATERDARTDIDTDAGTGPGTGVQGRWDDARDVSVGCESDADETTEAFVEFLNMEPYPETYPASASTGAPSAMWEAQYGLAARWLAMFTTSDTRAADTRAGNERANEEARAAVAVYEADLPEDIRTVASRILGVDCSTGVNIDTPHENRAPNVSHTVGEMASETASETVGEMASERLDPAFVHAYLNTGFMVTPDNVMFHTVTEVEEWTRLVTGFRERHHHLYTAMAHQDYDGIWFVNSYTGWLPTRFHPIELGSFGALVASCQEALDDEATPLPFDDAVSIPVVLFADTPE